MSYEPERRIKKLAATASGETTVVVASLTDESVWATLVDWPTEEHPGGASDWIRLPPVPGTPYARELEAHQGLPEDDETDP